MKIKKKNSLLIKYLIILFLSILLFPFIMLGSGFSTHIISEKLVKKETPKYSPEMMEKRWHEEAKKMQNETDEQVIERLDLFLKNYPEGSAYWIDEQGHLKYAHGKNTKDIPQTWTSDQVVHFMKTRLHHDPYTIVSLVGEQQNRGFVVFEIKRKYFDYLGDQPYYVNVTATIAFISIVLFAILFVVFSILFFNNIRKRLVQLQHAMQITPENPIPTPVVTKSTDEIGDLERSFNQMIDELEKSKRREQQEEQLRRQLIANLSHDLRTPLTTIQGHVYKLKHEPLSEKGQQSIGIIHEKIRYLSELLDNLLSFTLLSAKRLPFHPKEVFVVEKTRQIMAAWYPLFEQEGFTIEVHFKQKDVIWNIDELWFERIWNNIFQNVLRHAKSGRYLFVSFSDQSFKITDHGAGIEASDGEKGAQIGLTIVKMMCDEMKIHFKIMSTKQGTTVFLKKIDS